MPTDVQVEKVAEALWQAESMRALGSHRREPWSETGDDTQNKWRFMARAALLAAEAAAPEPAGEGPPKPVPPNDILATTAPRNVERQATTWDLSPANLRLAAQDIYVSGLSEYWAGRVAERLLDAVAARGERAQSVIDNLRPIDVAFRGFKAWAEKSHNKKWFRKIDGTPIPNDLPVCIAMEFVKALDTEAAPSPPDAPQEG